MKTIKVYLKKNIKNIILVVLASLLALSVLKIDEMKETEREMLAYRQADVETLMDIIYNMYRFERTPESTVCVLRDAILVAEYADIPYRQEVKNALEEMKSVFDLRVNGMETYGELEDYYDRVYSGMADLIARYRGCNIRGTNEEYEQSFKESEEYIMAYIRDIDSNCHYIIDYAAVQAETIKEFELEDSGKMVVSSRYLGFYNYYNVFVEMTVCMKDGSTIPLIKDRSHTEYVEKIYDNGLGEKRVQKICTKEALDCDNIKSIIINGEEYMY